MKIFILFIISAALYCYQHNVFFENAIQCENHEKECEQLLKLPRVCTQNTIDGNMCGEFFTSISLLKEHVWLEHQQIICEECDAQYNSYEQLHNHRHRSRVRHKNIYESMKIHFY